jgi:hypothetical protein
VGPGHHDALVPRQETCLATSAAQKHTLTNLIKRIQVPRYVQPLLEPLEQKIQGQREEIQEMRRTIDEYMHKSQVTSVALTAGTCIAFSALSTCRRHPFTNMSVFVSVRVREREREREKERKTESGNT